jgi:hypothetical protein
MTQDQASGSVLKNFPQKTKYNPNSYLRFIESLVQLAEYIEQIQVLLFVQSIQVLRFPPLQRTQGLIG